jgi:Zn-finger protein
MGVKIGCHHKGKSYEYITGAQSIWACEGCRNVHNKELNNLHISSNIIRVGEMTALKFLTRSHKDTILLGVLRRKWGIILKCTLKD